MKPRHTRDRHPVCFCSCSRGVEADPSGPTAPTGTSVVSCGDLARNDDDSAKPHRDRNRHAGHRRGDVDL